MVDTSSKADGRRRFKWLRLGLWLLVMPLLLALGGWQLQRAEQKRVWLQQLSAAPSTTVSSALERLARVDWVPVRLEVELMPVKVFLLDNRTWQGRVGYDVVVPVRVDAGPLWLARLGWVAAPVRRDQLPELQLQPQWLPIEAVLSRAQASITLAVSGPEAGWPRRIQSLDMEQIRTALAVPVEPLVLHLSSRVDDSIQPRELRHTGMPPVRHLGYAAQWFGLALALAAWLIWSARREREESRS